MTDPARAALERLADETAITALLNDVCTHLDTLDLDRLAELFTPDCRVRYGNVQLEGRDGTIAWLAEAIASPDRDARLTAWEEAPAARVCHPREEHLIPLMVAAGAATEPGRVEWTGRMFGKRLSAHHFG